MDMEKLIQDRLVKSYSMDKGLASAAAHEILDDILTENTIEPKPYLDTKAVVANEMRKWDAMLDIIKNNFCKEQGGI